MKAYQKSFIQLALKCEALQFGDFTLKSGRRSPYFFNAGKFQSGKALAELGRHYASAIVESGLDFDMIFGPAYKGIPLATTTAVALADHHERDVPYAFNRKEAKSHGEGGTLVGAALAGRVAIIDDVITAGTAVREVLSMLNNAGASAAAIVIGLNRQERGQGSLSTIDELQQETGVPVVSIVSLEDIMTFLAHEHSQTKVLDHIQQYREQYGAWSV